MKPKARAKKIRKLEARLTKDQEKLAALKRRLPPEPVTDYTLTGWGGPVTLSALFGDRRDLIVIHNMGRACRHCTLWADGFNGLYPHLADRAAFVVVSPNTVKTQQAFARSRGWRFPMASGRGSPFTGDMGFMQDGEPMPGASTFRRTGKKIARVASAPFGSFDPFCSAWHLFALLQGGIGSWEPQYRY